MSVTDWSFYFFADAIGLWRLAAKRRNCYIP